MKFEDQRAAIIGGGIGGLACALLLSKLGFQIEIFESRSKLPSQGAGIQISPNAGHILNALDVDISPISTKPQSINIFDKSSTCLSKLSLAGFEARYGMPYQLVYRADLLKHMYQACQKSELIELKFNQPISVSQIQDRDLVVIADGIWSKNRMAIAGSAPARNSQYLALRALINFDELSENLPQFKQMTQVVSLWAGSNGHAVFYPLSDNRINIVLVYKNQSQAQPQWNNSISDTELQFALGCLSPQLAPLQHYRDQFSIWPIYKIPNYGPLFQNNLVLLGDAAHGMEPFAAQGGAMALEDAAVLSKCLASEDTLKESLTYYQTLRLPRLRKVKSLTKRNGYINHLSGPMAEIRNTTLKILPSRILTNRLDWLYGWRA